MARPGSLNGTRVLIYGVTGSGKTTLAARIAERSGLPWHSVDDLTFNANWEQVPDEEQRRRIAEICEGSSWILDTAYGRWMDIPLSKADVLVALDYPRSVSLSRLVKRTVARVIDKRLICNGNQESLRTMFSRDSIILWHFRSFDRKRARIRQWETDSPGPRVMRFSRPQEVEQWLAELGQYQSSDQIS